MKLTKLTYSLVMLISLWGCGTSTAQIHDFADRDARQNKSENTGSEPAPSQIHGDQSQDLAPIDPSYSNAEPRGVTPQQEMIQAEDLTDDDIQQILANEGIPVSGSLMSTSSESRYTLGPNDRIEIMVMRHPEVSGVYQLNNEGKIQYDFVGDVELAGMTKNQAAEALTEILGKYIISPELNVKIVGYNSKVVYVIGEVGSPGKIYMHGDTITVREALVQANLPLLSAKTGAGRLVTPSADGRPKVRKVNLHRLLVKGDLRENLVMNPGDTLYVPPTFFARAMRIIQPVASPVNTTFGTGRNVQQGFTPN